MVIEKGQVVLKKIWTDLHPEVLGQIHLDKKDPPKVWINKLELVVIIGNLYVASVAITVGHMKFDWQPVLHCGGNNKSGNRWAEKPQIPTNLLVY